MVHTPCGVCFDKVFCRLMQKSMHNVNPEYLDGKYWADSGWLGSIRP